VGKSVVLTEAGRQYHAARPSLSGGR
jgi:hypothetical protein